MSETNPPSSTDLAPSLDLGPSGDPASPWPVAGDLTVQTVEAVRGQLLERLKGRQGVVLDLSGVTACDCAGLQLLCAARHSARARGQPFALGKLPPVLLAATAALGLDPTELTGDSPVTRL